MKFFFKSGIRYYHMFEAVWCVTSRHFYLISLLHLKTSQPVFTPTPKKKKTKKHPLLRIPMIVYSHHAAKSCWVLCPRSEPNCGWRFRTRTLDACDIHTVCGVEIFPHMAHTLLGIFLFFVSEDSGRVAFFLLVDVVGTLGGPTVDEVVGKNASETADLSGIPLQITWIQVGEDDQSKRGHLFWIYRGCIVHYIWFVYCWIYKF